MMNRNTFCHQLLHVMDAKDHWAWPAFTSGMVPKNRLHIHFEQEYASYVRDFPVMVGWVYVQCPIPEVRRALAENLYEERALWWRVARTQSFSLSTQGDWAWTSDGLLT